MSTYCSLTPSCRFLVAEYVQPYVAGNIRDRATHEILTLLPEADWAHVTAVFRTLVGDMAKVLPTLKSYHAQLVRYKEYGVQRGQYLSLHFRILPSDLYQASYEVLICNVHSIFKNKAREDLPYVQQILDLLKGLFGNNKEVLQGLWIDHIPPYLRHLFQLKPVEAELVPKIIMASLLFQFKGLIEAGIRARKFARLYNETRSDPIKTIQVPENVECKSFFYRCFKKSPTGEIISKVTPEYVEDFLMTYSNPKPYLRDLFELCKRLIVKQESKRQLVDSFGNFLYYFLQIRNNETQIRPLLDLFGGEVILHTIEKIKTIFLEFKLPPIGKKVFMRETAKRLSEQFAREDYLQRFAKVMGIFEEFRPTLHLLYALTFETFQQLQPKVPNNRGVEYLDVFSQLHGQTVELPKPLFFPNYFQPVRCYQLELPPEPQIEEAKGATRKEPAKKEKKVTAPPKPSVHPPLANGDLLHEIHQRRDFPLHDFVYDTRVMQHFVKVDALGDWALCDWNTQRHGFGIFIDQFVGTVYSQKEEEGWTNTTTQHQDLSYSLIADVILPDSVPFTVTINYTRGKDKKWYHRYMSLMENETRSSVEKPTLAESKKTVNVKKKSAFRRGVQVHREADGSLFIDFNTYQIRLYRLR